MHLAREVVAAEERDDSSQSGRPLLPGCLRAATHSLDVEANGESFARAFQIDKGRTQHAFERGDGRLDGGSQTSQAT